MPSSHIGGLVGKTSSRTRHRYGPNGIGMRRGAQYKVLSTIFNILRQVSLIQCTCVGHHISTEHFTHERRLRPRDRPRSSQRPRHYRCCTCTCAARHARKDRAAKHPERMRQSRTRAAARQTDHALRARLAVTANIAKSPLSLVDAKPIVARDHGSSHTDDCKRAEELATLLLATKLLQPPSAGKAAKPCGGARLSGCQLQQQSQGAFEINEMRTRGAPKMCGHRQT